MDKMISRFIGHWIKNTKQITVPVSKPAVGSHTFFAPYIPPIFTRPSWVVSQAGTPRPSPMLGMPTSHLSPALQRVLSSRLHDYCWRYLWKVLLTLFFCLFLLACLDGVDACFLSPSGLQLSETALRMLCMAFPGESGCFSSLPPPLSNVGGQSSIKRKAKTR